jgi:phosphoribosylanthranilate isomerase
MNGHPTPVRVKVCGITRLEDAELAIELGADYLGLNFYPESPRYISPTRAAEIAQEVAGRVGLVGIFVDTAAAEISEIAGRVGLDLAQLHGDEGPQALDSLGVGALKAFRLAAEAPPPELAPWAQAWGFLFEARQKGLYGGGGRAWAYERIAGLETDKPVFVAGGIRPETVRRALELSGAWGLDVCSGVEASPGVKDPNLLRQLFREVQSSLGVAPGPGILGPEAET